MNQNIAILQYANKRRPLTDKGWDEVDALVRDGLPEFQTFMGECKQAVGLTDYRTCLLLRLKLRVKDIAKMLGVSQPYVSKVSKSILLQLWGETGSSKELAKKLENT